MEINGDVTDAGRTNERRRTREDRATQPMDAGWLSFAISSRSCEHIQEHWMVVIVHKPMLFRLLLKALLVSEIGLSILL